MHEISSPFYHFSPGMKGIRHGHFDGNIRDWICRSPVVRRSWARVVGAVIAVCVVVSLGAPRLIAADVDGKKQSRTRRWRRARTVRAGVAAE